MKVEFEKDRNRERYRFNLEEVKKYAGKDIPHTVIKSWIIVGKNLEESLTKIEGLVDKCANNSLKANFHEIEKKLNFIDENQNRVFTILLMIARLAVLSSSSEACKFSSYDRRFQEVIKLQDKAFCTLAKELFPEINLDYFMKNIIEGVQK